MGPNLSKVDDNVPTGGCVRACLTFRVPKGTDVSRIAYAPSGGQALTWAAS